MEQKQAIMQAHADHVRRGDFLGAGALLSLLRGARLYLAFDEFGGYARAAVYPLWKAGAVTVKITRKAGAWRVSL